MNTTLSKPVAVQGGDIDPATCKTLMSADKVLVEINGERLFGHGDNPLLADEPWTVESNDENKIVLSHPFHPQGLTLHYANMTRARGPAVFVENDPEISPTKIYVILQFVSHFMPGDDARLHYPNCFHQSFLHQKSRERVIDALINSVNRLETGGWKYISKCRFSLRSGVSISELNRFAHLDSEEQIDDNILNRIGREFGWMDSLKAATQVMNRYYDAPSEAENEIYS